MDIRSANGSGKRLNKYRLGVNEVEKMLRSGNI